MDPRHGRNKLLALEALGWCYSQNLQDEDNDFVSEGPILGRKVDSIVLCSQICRIRYVSSMNHFLLAMENKYQLMENK